MTYNLVNKQITIDLKKAGTKLKIIKLMLQLNNTKEASQPYGFYFEIKYKDVNKELANVFTVPIIEIPETPTTPAAGPEIPGSSTTDPGADTAGTGDTASTTDGDGTAASTDDEGDATTTRSIDSNTAGTQSGGTATNLPTGVVLPGQEGHH